ncbi:hypothetical protein PSEUBRA_004642 [Kalmanozyma brasiliensis GHG001]|uniref:uncharacterized protein n=1 Tax=Kalmanozyma brasiliensis (strain GHG001) TaxID=1365824 RepID=UPI002867EE55|nr:uncharacterized protein PSEUBRA_004642 [Kalmanozyma brasiliensis GHG001]KAF6767399.1 hypothetical protein PSEUBRA_004642 [Kalmanozyma brasiliensis GHG001]
MQTPVFFAVLFSLHTVVSGAAVAPQPDTIAVCSLPSTFPLGDLTSPEKGIHFSPCPPTSLPTQLALVSISADSPLKQQLFDIDARTLDAYWLERYIKPHVGEGRVRCWDEEKCTTFGMGPGLQKPPGGEEEKIVHGSVRSNEGG